LRSIECPFIYSLSYNLTTNITNDDDDDDDDKVGKWTVYHEAALSTDDV